jgi:3-methyladenine DNA glycosylase/8-oxoguanine DNA glycosylase
MPEWYGPKAAVPLSASSERTFPLDHPYDLGRSLLLGDLGRANPTLVRPNEHELLRANWTPEGPASVHVRVRPGALEARAWGPGRSWLLDALPGHLGLADQPPRFADKLGRLQRQLPGVRRGRSLDLFELLTGYVIRQRVAWRDAVATQAAILRAHAQPAPGPAELRLGLSPEQWLALTTADLAAHGLERKRAQTILSLAARADRIRSFATLGPEVFASKLESFTGIGPWTSAMVCGHGLGDHDAVPLGDYDLPSTVAWFFVGEPRADDARMLELLEPHRGQRFRVIHLLWAAGLHAPRFGPRIRGARP